MRMQVCQIPVASKRVDIVIGTNVRPASKRDVDDARGKFDEALSVMADSVGIERPKVSAGIVSGQFPSCRVPEVVDVEDLYSATDPSRTGAPEFGVRVMMMGTDDEPVSQDDIDEVVREIGSAPHGVWIVTHHAIDITYA